MDLYFDCSHGGTLSKTIHVIEGVLRTGHLIPDGIARHRCDAFSDFVRKKVAVVLQLVTSGAPFCDNCEGVV